MNDHNVTSIPFILRWIARFNIERPLEHFPRPICITRETAHSAIYRSDGNLRQSEKFCIFYYVLSGTAITWRENRVWQVPEGSCFINIINEKGSGYGYPEKCVAPLEFMVFCFTGGNVREMVLELIERYGPVFAIPSEHGLIHLLQNYKQDKESTHRLTSSAGSHLVMEILTTLGESAQARLQHQSTHPIIEKACAIIDKSIQTPCNAKELADRLGVSREHLSRIFKDQKGLPLAHYIKRKKIIHACKLLKETTLTTKEISAQLGFDQPTNFVRLFHGIMHMPPRKFRKSGIMPFM